MIPYLANGTRREVWDHVHVETHESPVGYPPAGDFFVFGAGTTRANRRGEAAMSKFRVGDRVRRAKHTGVITNCPIGFETTVDDLLGYSGGGFWYKGADGYRQSSTTEDDWELADAGPVRTVTRKEIVPGVYHGVDVSADTINGSSMPFVKFYARPTPAELRAAARVFNELADALDGVL